MKRAVTLEAARAAKKHAARVVARRVGEEVAVGITGSAVTGYALKINLTSDPGQDVDLPNEVDGVPLQVEVVGQIRKR